MGLHLRDPTFFASLQNTQSMARLTLKPTITLGTKYNVGAFNGCGMGPLIVLVSPCFRENVVGTCKIGSFFV